MKLAVLVSAYGQSGSSFEGVADTPVDPAFWVDDGHVRERFAIDKAGAVRQVRALVRRGFDAFVCLCDGAYEEQQVGVEVVAELERLGLA